MKTNDIIESLKMESIWRSNQPLPITLLTAIEDGLKERDALRTENERLNDAIDTFLHDWQDDDAAEALRILVNENLGE